MDQALTRADDRALFGLLPVREEVVPMKQAADLAG